LQKITVNGQRPGPHLLITAGVHGDEYEPMEAVRRLINLLKGDRLTLSRGSVSLVPVVNEPAFQMASRYGPDGLDLARVCPGDASGSITMQIAAQVSELIKSSDYYIDMHGGGHLYDISPFAGYVLHQDQDIRQIQRTMARAFNFPMVWGTDPNLPGRTLSVARDAAVPGIYTEYGGGVLYRDYITKACMEGCLNVMKSLGFIEEPFEGDTVEYHIEDHRPKSGFLQHMMPSPKTGFFLPQVTLGQSVQPGDTVGLIKDVTGGDNTIIEADQPGKFFLMRSVPSVHQGDSLGGILHLVKNKSIVVIDDHE